MTKLAVRNVLLYLHMFHTHKVNWVTILNHRHKSSHATLCIWHNTKEFFLCVRWERSKHMLRLDVPHSHGFQINEHCTTWNGCSFDAHVWIFSFGFAAVKHSAVDCIKLLFFLIHWMVETIKLSYLFYIFNFNFIYTT